MIGISRTFHSIGAGRSSISISIIAQCLGQIDLEDVSSIANMALCKWSIWMFPKKWYSQIIHFNRVFHYTPSILGYPYFWKHPYENPAEVLMKESLCEALFCLESGSKLWKAMLVNYQKRYVAIAISWNTISSFMLALVVKCEIVRDTFLAHKCSQR